MQRMGPLFIEAVTKFSPGFFHLSLDSEPLNTYVHTIEQFISFLLEGGSKFVDEILCAELRKRSEKTCSSFGR